MNELAEEYMKVRGFKAQKSRPLPKAERQQIEVQARMKVNSIEREQKVKALAAQIHRDNAKKRASAAAKQKEINRIIEEKKRQKGIDKALLDADKAQKKAQKRKKLPKVLKRAAKSFTEACEELGKIFAPPAVGTDA